MNPGIYEMPIAEYLADPCAAPSLSSGIAHLMIDRSPLHAWIAHPRLNPKYMSDEDTKFDIGTAAHQLFLEGEDSAVIIDAEDWRKKDVRALRDSLRAQGKLPLLAKHHDAVVAMANVARTAWASNPDLSGYGFDQGSAEQTLIWQEGSSWCRGRADWISHDRRLIVDYKTTGGAAEPNGWARAMLDNGYDVQAAHYTRGAHLLTGDIPKFVFMVQETESPYAVSFCGMSPAFMEMGRDKIERALHLWESCMQTNQWPGYVNRICWIEPPTYALNNWADRVDAEEGARGNPYDPADLWEKPL